MYPDSFRTLTEIRKPSGEIRIIKGLRERAPGCLPALGVSGPWALPSSGGASVIPKDNLSDRAEVTVEKPSQTLSVTLPQASGPQSLSARTRTTREAAFRLFYPRISADRRNHQPSRYFSSSLPVENMCSGTKHRRQLVHTMALDLVRGNKGRRQGGRKGGEKQGQKLDLL